jgi:hypothetical protein
LHVRLQAPRRELGALGFYRKIVEKFGSSLKEILDGFTAPVDKVNIDAFKKALSNFITDVDRLKGK